MKKIIFLILISITLNANITINQNLKALYKGVILNDTQEEYILDNQDDNIEIIKKALNKQKKKLKNENEKIVISFIIDGKNNVNKFKFLKRSDKRKIDKLTKNTIKNIANKLITPSESTELRFIISYNFQKKVEYPNTNSNSNTAKEVYQNMPRGTTRFAYSSKEYIRTFETTKDGFINMTQNPRSCAKRVTILKENGQSIANAAGNLLANINKKAPKGKYKILVQTKKDCKINLDYQ